MENRGGTTAIFRSERLESDDMSKTELVIAQETKLALERHLEDQFEISPRALGQESFLWIGRQTSVTDEDGSVYSDLLGVDAEGNLIIAELEKVLTPRDILAQLLDYLAWADGLSDSQIREMAEAYFETLDRFQGKTFDDAFRDLFNIPETGELPPLNRGLRLFIVAEEISSQVAFECRFLRTSHGMDVGSIDVSNFKTESGEVLISTKTKVGNEAFAVPSAQQRHPSLAPRWSGDKPVKQVVWEAVQEFTGGDADIEFAIKDLKPVILDKHPDFKMSNVGPEIASGCVNSPSRHHYRGADDWYWKIERGTYRLYDPEKDKMGEDSA